MKPQKPCNSPGPRPEIVDSRQRESGEKSLQLDVQNEMRGVLGRMIAGAAGRILDSANSREIRAEQKAVSVAAETREHKFLIGN